MNKPFSRTTLAVFTVIGFAIPVLFLGIAYFISVDVFIALAPIFFLLYAIAAIVYVSILMAFYAESKGKSPWIWSIIAISIVVGILITIFIIDPQYTILGLFLAPLLSILLTMGFIKTSDRKKSQLALLGYGLREAPLHGLPHPAES